MVDNKAGERWPTIELLSGLGWGALGIAKAIGWSQATIINDLRHKGGVGALFPNRPSGLFATYAATFKYYADHQDETNPTMEAIARFLQINRIVDFVDGMERTHFVLCFPGCPPELAPYIDFVFLLQRKDLSVSKIWRARNNYEAWLKYLADMANGQCDAPRSREQAVEHLLERFVLSCNRGGLFGPMLEGLREMIDGWLADEEQITPREQQIIISRYGLDGKRPMSYDKVAKETGVSRERIYQIETKVLRKLRSCWRMDKLQYFFQSFGDMTEQNRRLIEEIVQLKAVQATLSQHNTELSEAVRIGHGIEVRARFDRQVKLEEIAFVLDKQIYELKLSVRTANCLHNLGLESVGQLVQFTEAMMLKTRNCGRKSLNELKEILAKLGLQLGTELPPALAMRFSLPCTSRRAQKG